MKPIHKLTRRVAFVATLSMALTSVAQSQEEQQMPADEIDQMQAWVELAQPGRHHEHLAPYVGKWKSAVTMWMLPGSEPMTNAAEVEVRFILGDRYLEWRHSGIFGGMPFEGYQLDGYNNADQRYESTWADNFGTLILYYTGQCEDDGRSRTMHGEFSDPAGDGKFKQRAVYSWQDEDHWTYESYMSKDDAEFKNMEIRYSRLQ